ncbi:MAG TPA: four helix bundle protein [Candidatus Paceibacterota bacterium]
MKYDLEDRTKKFSFDVMDVLNKMKKNEITRPLISQCVRAATSVGANYREANAASSKKDFRNKIAICRKEVRETKYWIDLLSSQEVALKDGFAKIAREAHELDLIFNKIYSTLRASAA